MLSCCLYERWAQGCNPVNFSYGSFVSIPTAVAGESPVPLWIRAKPAQNPRHCGFQPLRAVLQLPDGPV